MLLGSALALIGQLAAPQIYAWAYRPRPGCIGIERFRVANQDIEALVYLPREYRVRGDGFRLLVYLHGSGSRGDDAWQLRDSEVSELMQHGDRHSYITVAPQCPAEMSWRRDWIAAIVDSMVARYRADPDRVTLAGYSMGGHGTWAIGRDDPARFAAMVPIAGSIEASAADALRDSAIWAFHGARDAIVPVQGSTEIVEAIRRGGGDARLTIYPDAEHGVAILPFRDALVWQWMESQLRRHGAR